MKKIISAFILVASSQALWAVEPLGYKYIVYEKAVESTNASVGNAASSIKMESANQILDISTKIYEDYVVHKAFLLQNRISIPKSRNVYSNLEYHTAFLRLDSPKYSYYWKHKKLGHPTDNRIAKALENDLRAVGIIYEEDRSCTKKKHSTYTFCKYPEANSLVSDVLVHESESIDSPARRMSIYDYLEEYEEGLK